MMARRSVQGRAPFAYLPRCRDEAYGPRERFFYFNEVGWNERTRSELTSEKLNFKFEKNLVVKAAWEG